MSDPSPTPVTPARIMQFAWSFAPPLAIEAAVRDGVFDALAQSPQSVDQVSATTGCSVRGLTALMNLLAGLGLLAKQPDGRYALAPESETYLVSAKTSFIGGLFKHISAQLIPLWLPLGDIVRTGAPAAALNQESEGSPFFQDFVEALFPLNYPAAREFAEALNIAAAHDEISVLDLAAGSGVWGIALAQASPHVRVTAVDWPGVLSITRRVAARFGLQERFQFVAGDLVAADFGAGHRIATLGHILHSEGRDHSRALLRKTFQALAPGGTIAIAEFLVNHDRTGPTIGLIFAINMLVNSAAGDTFSFEEISGWLEEAGFINARLLDVTAPSPLILADKPRS